MQKTAIITGITGQDGAYLSELLLKKGYRVVGLTRSYSSQNTSGLEHLGIEQEVILQGCDVTDFSQIFKVFKTYEPSEIYNLAAQSSVSLSFRQPIGTIKFNIISVLNLLESIRLFNPDIRFYQASSSEMFGKVAQLPITENQVFHPLSPYAISKASAHWIAINYREAYNLYTACGVLFNHESYLRSPNFFVKKVIAAAINIKRGEQKVLRVGNIEVKRDFGWAPKYVEAMYLMLQQEQADDYLICSGCSISLRSIVEYVFDYLSIDKAKIVIDPALFRPTDIIDIYGDSSKAKTQLDWKYDLSFFEVLDHLIAEELRTRTNHE
ncbi:MAG: GDP-mannose 4,6-dehydratase [Bacteroidota bacterium]